MKLRLALMLLPLALSACALDTSAPEPGYAAVRPPPVQLAAAPANGAIYQAAGGYAGLHEGLRARRVGDVVTVLLVEEISTSKNSNAQTDRDGSAAITPPSAGPLSFLNPESLKLASTGSFKGSGNAAQRSTLNGAVSVTIAEVRPNRTAYVVGERHMTLSQGREWVQFAGLVRLDDISGDNTIASTRVADARIIYSGKGAIQQASRPGWLSRFFNLISPF